MSSLKLISTDWSYIEDLATLSLVCMFDDCGIILFCLNVSEKKT